MKQSVRLAASLLALRLSIFLVMFMWTLDKFLNPEHAASVFEKFYGLSGLGGGLLSALAAAEMAVLAAFAAGLWKRWTYGAVLLFHAISTLASFPQYLSPWEGGNLLFYAAWPMLAACYVLITLRHEDIYTIRRGSSDNSREA